MRKMMIFAVMLIVLVTNVVSVQQSTSDGHPFDVSRVASEIDELGFVTQPEVDLLEQQAKELFNSGDCEAAIPVLENYMKKSNWLANLIAATLDPYYNADYDDRKAYPHARLQSLIPLEKLANAYKTKRNIAYAMQGECLLKTGDQNRAIAVLVKALDLIDIDNESWWRRTRSNLLQLIEVKVDQ